MNDRLITIVQDYALLTEYLNQLCCAIHNKNLELPNYACHERRSCRCTA